MGADWRSLGLTLAAAGLLGACQDGAGPGFAPDSLLPDSLLIDSLAIVSDPVLSSSAAASGAARSAVRTVEAEVAYVSLPPGTVANGTTARIRNRNTGNAAATALIDGGFDPVPVAASAGDILEIEVQRGDASPTVWMQPVPNSSPPRMVRTDPSHRKREVPLKARMLMVFSEPVDPRTVTMGSIQLFHLGIRVAGTLAIPNPDHLTAELVPSTLLDGGAAYTLVITQDIRDLNEGEPLLSPVGIRFNTEPGLGGTAADLAFATADALSTAKTIYLTNWDGSGRRILITLPHNGYPVAFDTYPWGRLAWSPDGGRLAFQDGRGALFVVNADGGGFGVLDGQPGSTDILSDAPAWSPDGSKIAFASFEWYWADQGTGIYVTTPTIYAGGALAPATRLTFDYDWWPAWSPDGKKIAFVRFDQSYFINPGSAAGSDIFVMNADGSAVTQLTSTGWPVSGLAWSPDGSKIAFSADTGDCQPIMVMNADGSETTGLTKNVCGIDRYPSWSPDGTMIVFERDLDIYIMNADGSNVTQLTSGLGVVQPAWSPRR